MKELKIDCLEYDEWCLIGDLDVELSPIDITKNVGPLEIGDKFEYANLDFVTGELWLYENDDAEPVVITLMMGYRAPPSDAERLKDVDRLDVENRKVECLAERVLSGDIFRDPEEAWTSKDMLYKYAFLVNGVVEQVITAEARFPKAFVLDPKPDDHEPDTNMSGFYPYFVVTRGNLPPGIDKHKEVARPVEIQWLGEKE